MSKHEILYSAKIVYHDEHDEVIKLTCGGINAQCRGLSMREFSQKKRGHSVRRPKKEIKRCNFGKIWPIVEAKYKFEHILDKKE